MSENNLLARYIPAHEVMPMWRLPAERALRWACSRLGLDGEHAVRWYRYASVDDLEGLSVEELGQFLPTNARRAAFTLRGEPDIHIHHPPDTYALELYVLHEARHLWQYAKGYAGDREADAEAWSWSNVRSARALVRG